MVNNQYNVTLLTLAQTQQMKQDSVECIELTKQCEALPSNSTLCVDAQGCWDEKLIEPFTAANRDNYDIRRECNHSDPTACDDTKYVRKYLNLPEVRAYLNVDPRVPEWVEDSAEVYTVFSGRDWSLSYHTFVADLLNDGLRVLIYAGDADLMCNWIGNKAWSLALDWRGKDGFNAAEDRALVSHDPLVQDAPAVDAGVVRSFDNFAFARVFEAGHMVPMNQPAVSLDLINKFLYGQPY
jgi:carboxypeptidase C (cathepsin A)